MKEKSVTGYLFIMDLDAVKITVIMKKYRLVFSIFYLQMLAGKEKQGRFLT